MSTRGDLSGMFWQVSDLQPIPDLLYEKVHLWDFPPSRVFVKLNEPCRRWLFDELHMRCQTSHLLFILNTRCKAYGIGRRYNRGHIRTWKNGSKSDNGKIKDARIPLWVLIEFSKLLSGSVNDGGTIMRQIEREVEYCAASGKSIPVRFKFPLLLTPELVSVIFHLCGDGHIGTETDTSHYRQTNKTAFQNFARKLHNSFGDFRETIVEDSKIIIPRIITDFYQHYFGINKCRWNTARIPKRIKALGREFLVAGLAAFIVDEGHVGDHLEIYSSNPNLLADIREIAQKLGHDSTDIHAKYRYGVLNGYRFLIKKQGALIFYKDVKDLSERFPMCGLAHKSACLELGVKIKKRGWQKMHNGVTKHNILSLLQSPMTVQELSERILIPAASVREHLSQLRAAGKVRLFGKHGRRTLWLSKVQ
ncbi:MAG: winged helix-turn-helix domain-containing protein [Candidatus Hadarchaeota archaeon]